MSIVPPKLDSLRHHAPAAVTRHNHKLHVLQARAFEGARAREFDGVYADMLKVDLDGCGPTPSGVVHY